jgi:hypothetical protein
VGNLRQGDHCGDLGTDERIFTMDLQEVGCRSIDSIDLAQGSDRRLALVNVVMNSQVP